MATIKTDFPEDVKKLVEMMFTPGYKFPKQDKDDDLKVNVTECVSFGDLIDASKVEPQNQIVGGTIIGFICTVRKFVPGKYKVSVIQLYDGIDPIVLFHHEAVDPNLLAMQVIRLSKDYCYFHRNIHNSINRYDWCHWDDPEVDSDYVVDFESYLYSERDGDCDYVEFNGKYSKADAAVMSLLHKKFEGSVAPKVPLPNEVKFHFKKLIYFTKTEKAEQLSSFILKNQIRRSSTIKYLFSVQDDNGETVSLGVYFTPFNNGDWVYGKAFEDSATRSYFALVLDGYLDLSEEPWMMMFDDKDREKLHFSSIAKTELRFPMTEFMFNDNC